MAFSLESLMEVFVASVMSNLVAIITIILTLIGIIVSPYLIRSRVSSAQQEKYNQAKNSLLDLLENQVMNKNELSTERISNLQAALERRYSVSISERISTIGLLQDLLLRIEESKLDSEDKKDYSGEIEEKLDELRDEKRIEDLPIEYQLAIQEIDASEEISPQQIVAEIEKAKVERRKNSYENPLDILLLAFQPWNISDLPPQYRQAILRMGPVFLAIYVVFLYIVVLK